MFLNCGARGDSWEALGLQGDQISQWPKLNPLWLYSGNDKQIQGLDLIDRVTEELWVEVCDIVQGAQIKTIPKKKKCQKAKWLSEEALQLSEKRREVKGKGEKEIYPFECRVPKNNKERQESLLQWSMQRNRGKQ